jgi:hypothetical protein
MSVGKRFLLDANTFIEAHQSYYAFDICPGFWLALIRQNAAKRLYSIDKVKSELLAGHDKLSDWVKDRAKEFFKATADRNVAIEFGNLVNWVQNQAQFTTEAKAEFAAVADGWVIAYAKANGLIVVTHEEYAPDAKKKVPMPNVCLQFGVDYCNTFEMLTELGIRLVLKKRA